MFVDEMKGWLAQDLDDRRARRWLLVSIALHLPFTPLGPLFGLLALMTRAPQPALPTEELTGIPVELLEQSQPAEEPKDELDTALGNTAFPEFPTFVPRKIKWNKTASNHRRIGRRHL